MQSICIGIQVYAEPERLLATLDSVRTQTAGSYELLLLPDGPDAATSAQLADLKELKQSGTADVRGAAACFNRLAIETDADVIVFLESGALVGPKWLDRLLAALNADSKNGLAGPSTNCCWNEQGVYPRAGGTPEEIALTAEAAASRFGAEWRVLEPLWSLADFCYVVRREVIETVGGADESYGPGPCWEMDYNIRAARVGWQGVWACAAYVHRSPLSERRSREEARLFDANKRRYQDKFCGARLRGEKSDYRPHCRGDECLNFAPAELIEIRRTLKTETPQNQSSVESVAAEQAFIQVEISPPLVTCIMPTCDRRAFIPQSLRCFFRQDYPNLELVIVDDGAERISDCLPADDSVRLLRLDQKMTVGAKRNLACEQARGEIILHWDDDDWYPPWRVRAQVQALISNEAAVCGSSQLFYYDAMNDQAWQYSYEAPGAAWVGGNTLAYRRACWSANRFAEVQVGEDTQFVFAQPGRICDLKNPALCVAMIHAGNTSPKETGSGFWHREAESKVRELLDDELYFYRLPPASASPEWPLVSCIMPTGNRRDFVAQALRSFQAQDYPRRELVIVDDGDDPIDDLVEHLPEVNYVRLSERTSIGAKRNLAVQHARGAIIAHWDDDDWYAPDRLRYQVAPIVCGEADLTGLENSCVLSLVTGEFWTTQPELHAQMFVGNVHGGTLVCRRQIFEQGLSYPEISLAEDAWLIHYAVNNGARLKRLANPGVFVYVRHGLNAWRECEPGRFLNPAGWQNICPPAILPADIRAFWSSCRDTKFAGR